MIEPIELAFTVPCEPDHAFEVWTERTTLWWPPSHSVSQDPDLAIVIEPKVGGRIFERTSDGAEHDWGEVLAWEPPSRFAYLWHLRQDRADASEVEISFAPAEAGAEVRIVHRGWERLGAKGSEMRERNERGWSGLVPAYREACAE